MRALTTGSTVTIAANATDATERSPSEFFQGATKKNWVKLSARPYSFAWASVSVGIYTLTHATTNAGAITVSAEYTMW